ncbi:enoyl-CoA delta isomerase 1, peroxisomal-like [Apium graveolens]|uniref:enoyl-CoA delta isomerase 1, peroxisomal-like n=1 Tax=Apium graveolens TaxID=4045 RepID=UPI003D794400
MCTLEKRGSVYILTLTGNDEHLLNPSRIDSISAALHRVRGESTATPSTCTALITTGEGMFFSNGGDIPWVQSNKQKFLFMMSKIRGLLTDFMSLPMPTIAAVNGHATCAGVNLALCHDYIFMRKDCGYLYINFNDVGRLPTFPYVRATIRAKISSPAVWRDLIMSAQKIPATMAVEKGIIDAAYDTVEETVAAAIDLGEQLVMRKWKGHVYAENRKLLFPEVLQALSVLETDESVKNSLIVPIKDPASRL